MKPCVCVTAKLIAKLMSDILPAQVLFSWNDCNDHLRPTHAHLQCIALLLPYDHLSTYTSPMTICVLATKEKY